MTAFKQGDMWTKFGKVDLFCIAISGSFRANGHLIMDTGMALIARERIPYLEQISGEQLRTYYAQEPYMLPTFYVSSQKQAVGLFQVRYHYKDKISVELGKRSAVQLFRYIASYPKMTACLELPSQSIDILPIIELLPNNVEIWEYES